jgi:hypothetical protein
VDGCDRDVSGQFTAQATRGKPDRYDGCSADDGGWNGVVMGLVRWMATALLLAAIGIAASSCEFLQRHGSTDAIYLNNQYQYRHYDTR